MPQRAGALRPSQAVTQFGPGSLVDLPSLSMVIAGLDDWNTETARRVDEPRLAAKLGVDFFRRPPYYRRKEGIGGMPARIFPSFLVCPRCNRLAPYGQFQKEERTPPEYVCAEHSSSRGKPPTAYPARFIVVCSRGHLDDFPWHQYVHPDIDCDEELRLEDSGRTGSITDLWVKCEIHDARKNLGQAMGRSAQQLLACRGARPWLGPDARENCSADEVSVRVILRGASNSYFPVVESAISVPPWADPIQLALGEYVDQFAKVDSLQKMQDLLELMTAPALDEFSPEAVWEALRHRRGESVTDEDLRIKEWANFTRVRTHIDPRSEFQTQPADVAPTVADVVARVTQVVRLREVRALRGFTRIDPIPDVGELGEVEAIQAGLAPIAKKRLNWLPGIALHGEGVFLEFDEERVREWERQPAIAKLEVGHQAAQEEWYRSRGLDQPTPRPARYLLLHSMAHLLIREFGLECGYAAASLRERIYCASGTSPMAGLLIYTASADSEGSLGGLVEMARPDTLGPMLDRALRESKLCSNDPLCSDRATTRTGTQLNGAACHACLLGSETSCESGNNYLDRALLAGTLRTTETAFVAR